MVVLTMVEVVHWVGLSDVVSAGLLLDAGGWLLLSDDGGSLLDAGGWLLSEEEAGGSLLVSEVGGSVVDEEGGGVELVGATVDET